MCDPHDYKNVNGEKNTKYLTNNMWPTRLNDILSNDGDLDKCLYVLYVTICCINMYECHW